MQVILIFIDGMGIGSNDQQVNPYITAKTPFLDELMGGHYLLVNSRQTRGENWAINPLDACLGVPGLPQSATGQATLLTGKNCSAYLGKHLRGFPNCKLRYLIKEENIYCKLKDKGHSCTFANVYRPIFFKHFFGREKYYSATTVAATAANIPLRRVEDLLSGEGVYQDFTNKILRDESKLDVPLFDPLEAGIRLGKISTNYCFTLYEYYQTDVSGHRQNYLKIQGILTQLDTFLKGVITSIDLTDTVVMITSDHGNIEDISHPRHTGNPVPLLVISDNRDVLTAKTNSLADIAPLVLELVAS